MRSGMERLTYAIIIIVVATITAWLMALLLHLHPVDFPALSMSVPMHIILRLVFSFCGVFGFSIMFNSPWKLAATAALIGAVANTLRLELVDLASFPPAAAAFVGALLAGILASLIKTRRDIQGFHLRFRRLSLWYRDCICTGQFTIWVRCL